MAVYQEKAKTRIKNGISGMNRIIEKGKADGYNEADTRKKVKNLSPKSQKRVHRSEAVFCNFSVRTSSWMVDLTVSSNHVII